MSQHDMTCKLATMVPCLTCNQKRCASGGGRPKQMPSNHERSRAELHTSGPPLLRVSSGSVARPCEGAPSSFIDDFCLRFVIFFAERGRLGRASAAGELGPASELRVAVNALVTRALGSRCAAEGSVLLFFCLLLLRGRLALVLGSSLDCSARSWERLRALRVSGIVDGSVCHYTDAYIPELDL